MASCSCSAKCLLSTEQTGSSWQASVSLANKSSHKDSSQPFCIFLAQKDNFVFRDCLWKCGVNVTLKIGKCLLQYALELQKDYKNNKTPVSQPLPSFSFFFKEEETWLRNFILWVQICSFQKKKWIWVIIK